ncbi:MAG: hypothetical protein IJ649_02695, partial [Oscillospiraceae bacterium]|nr:hypothetical protein [Oscillospiraceae bacterium]
EHLGPADKRAEYAAAAINFIGNVQRYNDICKGAREAGAGFYVKGLDSSRADETTELAAMAVSYIQDAEEFQHTVNECEDIDSEWGAAAAAKHWERSKIGRDSCDEWSGGPGLVENVLDPLDLGIWINRKTDSYIAELQICWGGPGITAEYDSRYHDIEIRANWGGAHISIDLFSGALFDALIDYFETAYQCEIDC